MTLRRGAEVELRLLDQDHEAAHARLDECSERADERQPAVLGALGTDDADRALRRRIGRREEGRRSQVGREEEGVRRALAVQVQRLGRLRVEEQGAAPDLGFHVHALLATRDVLARRHGRSGLEEGPDRREHGRLARRRLADERTEGTRLEEHVAGAPEALDGHAFDWHAGGPTRAAVFRKKKRRLAGRSPSRRIRYGYHSGPYGVATSTL